MIVNLYFVRHGFPDYAHDCLTEHGKLQAERAAEFLKNIPFKAAYASELGRAVETASFLTKKLDIPIIKLNWAREDLAWQNFAIYQEEYKHDTWIFFPGKYLERMKELQEDKCWYKDPLFPPKVGEGIKRINDAVDEWLLSMNIKHDREQKTFTAVGEVPENIILFAHGGFGSAFFPSITDMIYSYYVSNYMSFLCCSISEVKINLDGKTPIEIIYYNYIEHLKKK